MEIIAGIVQLVEPQPSKLKISVRVRLSAPMKGGKMTQEKMIKKAMKSIKKNKHGKYRLVYKKDTRTIVAERQEKGE